MSPADTQLEVDDAVVLLLGAPTTTDRLKGKLAGVTRLEKLIFLLERETSAKTWLTEDADFTPYNFGPFSSKVYQAVDMLAAAGIITDSGANVDTEEDTWEQRNAIGEMPAGGDPYTTRDFALTDRGWRYYQVLVQRLPKGALTELSDFKATFASVALRTLVRYVYQRYDEFTTRSIIRDDILGT